MFLYNSLCRIDMRDTGYTRSVNRINDCFDCIISDVCLKIECAPLAHTCGIILPILPVF